MFLYMLLFAYAWIYYFSIAWFLSSSLKKLILFSSYYAFLVKNNNYRVFEFPVLMRDWKGIHKNSLYIHVCNKKKNILVKSYEKFLKKKNSSLLKSCRLIKYYSCQHVRQSITCTKKL